MTERSQMVIICVIHGHRFNFLSERSCEWSAS